MQNIHVNIIVPAGWFRTFYHTLGELSHDLVGLLENVFGDKIFDMALAETFEVPREVVEPYYNALVIRIFFEVFVN